MAPDPLAPFLSGGGTLVLDGGLATELEKAGFDLDHPLWSARLLRDAPEAVVAVHAAYFDAGADCITTASYQVTVPGLVREGLTEAQARALLLEASTSPRKPALVTVLVTSMTPAPPRRKGRRPYAKHGLVRLKAAVRGLGGRVIDRRTSVGRALDSWRSNLVADLAARLPSRRSRRRSWT